MVFHWSLSDSKSPQVSRTLHSIPADLNYAVVWMVSIHTLISKSPSTCTNTLLSVPSTLITSVSPSLSYSIVFSILLKSLGIYLSFRLRPVLSCDQPRPQSSLFSMYTFFDGLSFGLVVWQRLNDSFVPQNSREHCAFHFSGFWVVHIPFVHMIKFKLLARFSMDHLTHPDGSTFIFSLCWFTAFAYNVIDRFVSVTT